jgi:hypothetical protein
MLKSKRDKQELDILAQQVRNMSTRSDLYRVLKHELSARGWWKNKPRGKPNKTLNEK